jgi:hypothetical protein
MMKKIVLTNVTQSVEELIEERMKADNINAPAAVIAILSDAAIERAVEHDVALMESKWTEDDRADHSCTSGKVSITIQML